MENITKDNENKIAELHHKIEFSYAVSRMLCEFSVYAIAAIIAYFITREIVERMRPL